MLVLKVRSGEWIEIEIPAHTEHRLVRVYVQSAANDGLGKSSARLGVDAPRECVVVRSTLRDRQE